MLSVQEETGRKLAAILAEQMKQYEAVTVLGPTQPALAKARDIYRLVIYGKCAEYTTLRAIKDQMEEYMKQHAQWKDCRLQFDFNT